MLSAVNSKIKRRKVRITPKIRKWTYVVSHHWWTLNPKEKLRKRLISYEISRFYWSEWRDSNSRHPGPKPGALPTGPHPDIKLRESARCGQICGQGNSTTLFMNFQQRELRQLTDKQGSMQHFGKSNRFGVPAPKPGILQPLCGTKWL